MTDHQKTKIAEMRKAGCGYSKISKALSVSRDTVKTAETTSRSTAPKNRKRQRESARNAESR